jgi:hypothetical protein
MALDLGTLAARMKLDDSELRKGLKKADADAEKAGAEIGEGVEKGSRPGLAKLGMAIATVGLAAVAAGAKAVGLAGDYEQSVGAVDTVFKQSAAQIHRWADSAATDVGLTGNAYNELATLIGTQLKNAGTSMEELAPKTNDLIALGSDLSSMFGGSTKEAVEALSSALKGERDPIERYGITLNEANIQAEALALGLVKPVKNMDLIKAKQNQAIIAQRKYNEAVKEHGKNSDEALAAESRLLSANAGLEKALQGSTPQISSQAKATATLSLITKQSADSQGRFADEANTMAGQMQRAQATAEDMARKVGTVLLPAVTKVMTFINDVGLPALEDLGAGLADAGQWIQDNADWLGPLAIAVGVLGASLAALGLAGYISLLGGLGSAFVTLATRISLTTVATKAKMAAELVASGASKAMAAAQWLVNAAMSANPIGLVVLAIAALAAGLVYAYQHSETFRNVVNAAFEAVAAAGRWLWNNALQPALSAIVGGFAWVVQGIANMVTALSKIPGFEWAKGAADGLNTLAANARGAADSIQKIPDPKVDTGDSRAQVAELDRQIKDIKGKIVDAKARGDWAEVNRLKEKLAELKDKRVDVNAHVKKTGVTTLKLKDIGQGSLKISAYARGGMFAAGTYALVGEEGPELVRFNGSGGQVYPAAQTQRMLAGTSRQVQPGRSTGTSAGAAEGDTFNFYEVSDLGAISAEITRRQTMARV